MQCLVKKIGRAKANTAMTVKLVKKPPKAVPTDRIVSPDQTLEDYLMKTSILSAV
jgi:hypothetical protein